MAALTGTPASSFSIPVTPLATAAPVIPTGITSDVLERRPDVAQAERLVASQNPQIGVAQNAFYPSVSIFGIRGVQSGDVTNLISAPSALWILRANVTETVLSGGRRRAQLDFAKPRDGVLVATYPHPLPPPPQH